MAKLARLRIVDRTVLAAAGLSFMGIACGPSESSPQPGQTGGAATSGGAAGASVGGAAGSSGGAFTGGAAGSGTGGAFTGGAAGSGTGGAGTTGGASGAGGGGGGSGGGGTITDYNPDFVEFVGEDCELPEPALLSAGDHSLPDPFKMPDGTRMTSKAQWACQRAWLKKSIEAFVHGEKPGRPEVVEGSVSASTITVHVEQGGQSADFTIPISLPGGASGPVPGMFQANGETGLASFLKSEGVATMNYSHSTAESTFNKLYPGNDVSIQIKWAWLVSRAIDVLVDQKTAGSNNIIDPTALGTTGCSYAGKSAFTVGAFDERIALGLPVESGSGGLSSYRVIADGDLGPNQGGEQDPEPVSAACGSDWLAGTVCSGNVDTIPADAHFVAAMYAPRGFLTLDNNRIGHLGPVAQFAAISAAAEVFKALGVESNVGYHGGNDTDPHNHCMFYPSQEEPARKAIQAFLTKKTAPANTLQPKLKDGNDQPVNFALTDYVEWSAPVLQ